MLNKISIFGLFAIVLAAIFTVGYHYPDEHFQIFEFCNYKLGLSPAKDLAWEFNIQCRPGLLPLIAFCVSKCLIYVHLYNPFTIAFILRFLIGIFSWLIITKVTKILLPSFTTEKGKILFIGSSYLLWFVPYLSVRFSNENFAGLCFMLAISYFLILEQENNRKKIFSLFFTGFLLGLALFLRLQMGFACIGLGYWLLFIHKLHLKYWVILLIGALLAIGLNIVVDYWFYGNLVFTPFVYFKANIIDNVAANWGVYPWYWYFLLFVQSAFPPISLALMYLFFSGIKQKPFHLTSLICITFLLGHFIIGHKEMRFLFPISIAFIYIFTIAFDGTVLKYKKNRIFERITNLLIVINFIVFTIRTLIPAQEAVRYYEFLYGYVQKKPTLIFYTGQSPYNLVNVPINFYKPKGLKCIRIESVKILDHLILDTAHGQYLLITPDIENKFDNDKTKFARIYCLFPDWLLQFNVNNWEERSNIWTIYKISK